MRVPILEPGDASPLWKAVPRHRSPKGLTLLGGVARELRRITCARGLKVQGYVNIQLCGVLGPRSKRTHSKSFSLGRPRGRHLRLPEPPVARGYGSLSKIEWTRSLDLTE